MADKFFQYMCLNNKRTATEMDTVPESSIHLCTPPPPRYVLGIRNIKDYFILFYTKDMVSNRSVRFEAQRNVPYIYGGKCEFLSQPC